MADRLQLVARAGVSRDFMKADIAPVAALRKPNHVHPLNPRVLKGVGVLRPRKHSILAGVWLAMPEIAGNSVLFYQPIVAVDDPNLLQ